MRGSWRPNKDCKILTPNSSGYNNISFPFSWAAQPGASAGTCSHSSVFSPTNLNFLSPGLYNNLTPTYFLQASQFRTQFNPSTVKVAPDLLISSTGCTCYLYWCISSFDSLAGVNMQQKLDGNCTRMLRAILNKSWKQHPTKQRLYGHLNPISKTIQIRRTRHAEHGLKSKDELISDVLSYICIYIVTIHLH